MDSMLLIVLVLLVLILLIVQLRRTGPDAASGAVAEKLAHLEPVSRAVHSIQLGVAELHAFTRARHDLERQTTESIRRLETIIAGTQTRGAAGENILALVFSKLPAEWQLRNFKVGNKVVEFGLRLPNNLVLPIDSKWTATHLLERFAKCDDTSEQQRVKAQIEHCVLDRAREVKKYIDPSITTSFAIVAVPDSIYDLCAGIHCEAIQSHAVVISYSMFLPYILLILDSTVKSSHNIDLESLAGRLAEAQNAIQELQYELEGRFAKAMTMLANARNDMSVQLSRVSSVLTYLQSAGPHANAVGAPAASAIPERSQPAAPERVAEVP
jgi:DNA recombination protein RmuC